MKQILRSLLVALALVATPLAICAAISSAQTSEAVQVTPGNGFVRFELLDDQSVTVAIYSITGQRVKQLSITPGHPVEVELPAGYYIVKTPHGSYRILVK